MSEVQPLPPSPNQSPPAWPFTLLSVPSAPLQIIPQKFSVNGAKIWLITPLTCDPKSELIQSCKSACSGM
ncbi:hypothetical protein [Mycolicibacter sinensis]|uniref:hypothetical protein n=1 Tax=Mycolicibacter sinensis (strain JDM601) TaxID=875328 RepID=UPI00059CE337|nr:hypothetical protein [Mycolicibacter sinensis]